MPRQWHPSEADLLAEMYPHCHTEDVAAWLARSTKSVYEHAHFQGLRKTAEYLASNAACRIREGRTDTRMIGNQFRKGMEPWNKGKHHNPPGSAATRFRKGERHGAALTNFQPIGSLRVMDGVLQQKVTATGYPPKDWRNVGALVWERNRGPIPLGHIVIFRPGMRTMKLEEITVDRLECISRAENARRNHPKNKSPELARLYQLRGVITRQVNRLAREAKENACV